jgi:hypothetical protein
LIPLATVQNHNNITAADTRVMCADSCADAQESKLRVNVAGLLRLWPCHFRMDEAMKIVKVTASSEMGVWN